MTAPLSWQQRSHGRIVQPKLAAALAVAVSLFGLALRVEHALTFDGPLRGADYAVNVDGMRWMITHHRPFDFTHEVSGQVRYQPPLWYALGAMILYWTGHERPIAWLSVLGWVLRQLLLARLLLLAIPNQPWSRLIALSVHALLPQSVLTDGIVNPEGLHTALFMVAVYGLWCIEREAHSARGVTLRSAAVFGGFSGLAVLTKATAGVLPMAAVVVFAWQAYCVRNAPERNSAWLKLLRAGAVSGALFLAVAGFWVIPNLIKYHHPFPHVWNLATQPSEPVLYRRPLGWILPFEWRQYLKSPVIYTDHEPRPNFWAACITGTWTDFYNRGFCRLKGGGFTTHAWGANWAGMYGGPAWYVTLRCISLFQKLLWIGLFLTAATLLAWGYMLRSQLRSRGRSGSLVLPLVSALVVFFVMLFALVYPYDDNAVLNPRYLLPIAAPMSACLGIALGQAKLGGERLQIWAHALCGLAVSAVGVLLAIERLGG